MGVGDEVDAANALTLVDLADREEVRRALLIALKIRPRDREAFDDAFGRYWSGRTEAGPLQAAPNASAAVEGGPLRPVAARADRSGAAPKEEALGLPETRLARLQP